MKMVTAFERALEARPGNPPCIIHLRFVPSSRNEDLKAALDGPTVSLLSAMEAAAAGRGGEAARALEKIAKDAELLLETRQMPSAIAADGGSTAAGDARKTGGRKKSKMILCNNESSSIKIITSLCPVCPPLLYFASGIPSKKPRVSHGAAGSRDDPPPDHSSVNTTSLRERNPLEVSAK